MNIDKINNLVINHYKSILAAIVVAFLILQSINLSYRWVDDESWYLMPLPSIQNEGEFNIPTVPGDDRFWPQPPLLTYLEAGLDSIIPLTPSSARMIPLLFGCLCIIATFILGNRLWGITIGLWAAAFVASDNLIFLAARVVRPGIVYTFFLIVALIYAFKLIKSSEVSIKNVYLCGFFSLVGLWSHPNGLMIPVCVGLVLLINKPWNIQLFRTLFHYGIACLIFLLPLILWISFYDAEHEYSSFKGHWLGRYGRNADVDQSVLGAIASLVITEVSNRYADFIQFPFRLHIGILCVALIVWSFIRGDRMCKTIGAICVFQLLFFIFANNSNLSVRYMAVIMPLISLLGGYWLITAWRSFLRNNTVYSIVAALIIMVSLGASQFAGNALYLWQFRNADYNTASAKINDMIPPNSTVYGGMFWWLGLREHLLVPYMRTDWDSAQEQWQPNIVIMDDWVMTGGGPGGMWLELQSDLYQFLETNGEYLGEVDGGFYGTLKVYQVK